MCWSLEVTALFAFFETAALLYIWRRDEYNDRNNAIGHLPILAQEIIQVSPPGVTPARNGISF